jgi:hypothetical protein
MVGFAVTWWVATAYGHLDAQSAMTVATLVATLIPAPLGWWAAKAEPATQPAARQADQVDLPSQQAPPEPPPAGPRP